MNYHRLTIEKQLWDRGINLIAGIDEVGRGPLAGPVFACAVVFEKNFFLPEVQDSKKISAQNREWLAPLLQNNALAWSIGSASELEIDRINIRQATFLAMRRAIENLQVRPDYLLIDGENLPQAGYDARGIIKGDQLSFTIGAASIIAKVERDKLMTRLDTEYPSYKFAKNKGYGTAEHIRTLKMFGPSPYHRLSFLSKILEVESTEGKR